MTATRITRPDPQPSRSERRGGFLVEFAMVVPFVFLVIFGFVEYSRFALVRHGLEESARVGCRSAIVKGATVDDVKTSVANALAPFGVTGQTTTVSNLSVCQGDIVTVTITVPYSNLKWLPSPQFLSPPAVTVTCSLPKESDDCP
ncbi:MAG: TadE/TadG family type IV pilus assembly protein [Planctomycetaceae bacterium]